MSYYCVVLFFFSSRRRHTRCALVTGVQTCALPICFISTDDQAGLAELDRITAEAWRVIQRRYWLLSTSFTAAASATVATLLSGIALTWSETPGAEIVTLIGLGCFGSMQIGRAHV